MTKKAVLYRRVSSQRQSDEGKSLEDQETELLAFCSGKGWKVIASFEDARTGRRGSADKRGGLQEAMQLCCETGAVMVVYDLTRLARSVVDGCRIIERLQDCGAGIVILGSSIDSTTPMGKFAIRVLLSAGELQSDMIGEAVARANRQTVKRLGRRTQGEQPFGWRIKKGTTDLEEVPEEQAALARMKQLHKKKLSYAQIVEKLTAEGHKPRHAQKWTRGSVHRLLNQRKR